MHHTNSEKQSYKQAKTKKKKLNRENRKRKFCWKITYFSSLFKKFSAFSRLNAGKQKIKRKTRGIGRINESLIFYATKWYIIKKIV